MANQVLIPREQQVFCVAEVTAGTLVYPAGTDVLVAAGPGSLNQSPAFTPSDEVFDSRSLLAEAQDQTPAGEWSLPTYLRPSGTAGTPPAEHVLWQGLFGAYTNTAGTSDVYTPAKSMPTYSLWVRQGNVVFFASGCTVGRASLARETKGFAKVDWSGGFMRLGWCGEDTLAAAVSGSVTPTATCTVSHPERFTVGGRITVGTDPQVYEITAVDTATGDLTVTPSIDTDQASGATVSPQTPTAILVGTPIENRALALTLDGASQNFTTVTIEYDNGVEYLEEEATTSGYPEALAEGDRRITGNLTVLFRTADLDRFATGLAGSTVALALANTGAAAGSRFSLSLPYTRLPVPQIQVETPAIKLSLDLTCKAASGEDEATLTYS